MRLVVCLSLLLLQVVSYAHAQCVMNVTDVYHLMSPIFLDSKHRFVYPTVDSPTVMKFNWYEDRLVYCPGGRLQLNNNFLEPVPARPASLPLVVRCVFGSAFVLQRGNHPALQLDNLQCSEKPAVMDWIDTELNATQQSVPKTCSRGRGLVINLGFVIDEAANWKKPIIKLCYIFDLATTTWSSNHVQPSVNGHVNLKDHHQRAVKFDFEKGSLFQGISINTDYKACTQKLRFETLLWNLVYKDDHGNPIDARTLLPAAIDRLQAELDEKVALYVRWNQTHQKNNTMLVKGHLAAKGDFFHYIEQKASHFYANALPMWQTINNGNWKNMESMVRELAVFKDCILEVWTGGLGNLVVNNQQVFLSQRHIPGTRNWASVVPVPMILYKVVRCSKRKEALVFLAANNHLLEEADAAAYVICPQYQRCRDLRPQWYNFDKYGFVYCCFYHDFIRHPLAAELELPIDVTQITAPLF